MSHYPLKELIGFIFLCNRQKGVISIRKSSSLSSSSSSRGRGSSSSSSSTVVVVVVLVVGVMVAKVMIVA